MIRSSMVMDISGDVEMTRVVRQFKCSKCGYETAQIRRYDSEPHFYNPPEPAHVRMKATKVTR